MVRMGPPGGGGTSDDSTSSDSDSGSSSGGSDTTDYYESAPDDSGRESGSIDDPDSGSSSSSGSSTGSSGSSDSSTGSSDYGGGGIPDDIQDSDDSGSGSDTVGSPGPREREEARQEAEEQMQEDEPERTVGSPGPRERRRVRNQDDETTEQIERNVQEQTGTDAEAGEDFTTSERTYGGFSPSAQQRQRARQLREAEGQEEATDYLEQNTQERTVTSVNFTESFRREQAGEQLSERVEEEYGVDATAGEDFTVEETEDGGYRANFSDEVEQEIQESQQPGRTDDDIFSGVVSGTEDVLSGVAQTASGDESTRVEFRGEGSVVNVATQEDTDLTADLGPVSDVGDAATEAGEEIRQNVIDPTSEIIGPAIGQAAAGDYGSISGGISSTQTGFDVAGRIASATGDEEAAQELQQAEEDIEAGSPGVQTRTRFGEGAVSGGLGIANVPAIGGTVVDATEFVVEGGSRTAEGEGREFAQQAGGQAAVRGAQATEYASENPAEFSGQVAGGLATSSGAIRGAQAAGGARAGRAASFGIQPGEEIAITAARRGVPGAQRLAGAVSDVDVRSRASELASEERGTGQFRFESRSGTDTTPEDTVTIGRGEGEADLGRREPDPPQDMRTDITQEERRGQVQQRAEEGGMTDTERFDPTRGQTMMERRAQRRREQAEEPQVTEGDATFGAETDTNIAESVLRAEATTEGVQERTTQAQEQELTQAQELTPDVGEVSISDVAVETDTESRTDTRQETRQEPRQETRQETRTETRAEVRTEPRQETRTELRTELGLETRSEARSETEIDPELEEEENGMGFGQWRISDDQFSTGIADVDDLTENGITDDAEF